jgi:hypothetical protein
MRLFEVEDRFSNDLVIVLRTLRGRSDQKRARLPLPWEAVNSMLSNFGYSELDSSTLAKIIKQDPAVNAEVKTFDENGITVKTKAEKEQEPTDIPDGPSVDQMARSGSKDFQQDISK